MATLDVVQVINNHKGVSYGEWLRSWSNWFYSGYPFYTPTDDMLYLRGFVDDPDYRSSPRLAQFIREDDLAGRKPRSFASTIGLTFGATPPVKDIERVTEKRLILDRSFSRDESFKGEIVPVGTSILVPVLTTMAWIGGMHHSRLLQDEEEVRNAVMEDTYESFNVYAKYSYSPTLSATYEEPEYTLADEEKDQPIVPELKKYLIRSPLFTLRVSDANPFLPYVGLQPGNYDAMTAGYVLIIQNTKKGHYHFAFGGSGKDQYRTQSHYHIIVKDKRRDNAVDIS